MKKNLRSLILLTLTFILISVSTKMNAGVFEATKSAVVCPTANDLYYYFTPILNASGTLTGYRVTVCKKTTFTSCDVVVNLSIQGRSTSGTNITTNVTIVIPAASTCASVDVSSFAQIECIYYVSITCPCGGCLNPSDINYWVDVFEEPEGGGNVSYRLNACKIPVFNSCDVTVYFTVSGITGAGQPTTINTSVWISKSQTCGETSFGHAWLEVTSVTITSVVCSNCTTSKTSFSPGLLSGQLFNSNGKQLLSHPAMLIYPNPALNEFIIRYNSDKNEKVEINIYSYDGSLIAKRFENVKNGLNQIKQNTSSYAQGIYFVNLRSNGKLISLQKLVIIK